jgi:hypothetical protein
MKEFPPCPVAAGRVRSLAPFDDQGYPTIKVPESMGFLKRIAILLSLGTGEGYMQRRYSFSFRQTALQVVMAQEGPVNG